MKTENEIMEEISRVKVYFVVKRQSEDVWAIAQIQRGLRILDNLRKIPMHFPFGEVKCLCSVFREMGCDDRIIRIPNGGIGKTIVDGKTE